jgi:L-2-hydroxyglutarate oxidase
MTKRFDVVIIGGGVVGVATAFNMLALRPDLSLVILEKEKEIALHQTGRNSGVIHSGIYYRPGSLKARLCTHGYQRLIEFCIDNGVPFELCGKLIVAVVNDQVPQLKELESRGAANGLRGIKQVNRQQLREIEPHCFGVQGLFVPQTGIVNYVAVTEAMLRRVRQLGGSTHFDQTVVQIRSQSDGVRIDTEDDSYIAAHAINCGGLHSDRLARQTEDDLDLRILPFRGEYFELKEDARRLVRNLIYPVPNPAFPFLGVHFTRLIDGSVECGPNAVLSLAREGYRKLSINPRDAYETLTWPGFRKVASRYWRIGLGEYLRSFSKIAFVRALQTLVPEVKVGDLIPVAPGVRAQACDRQGNLLDDFALRESVNITHVCNAPSPAATASLAIGDYIANRVLKRIDER